MQMFPFRYITAIDPIAPVACSGTVNRRRTQFEELALDASVLYFIEQVSYRGFARSRRSTLNSLKPFFLSALFAFSLIAPNAALSADLPNTGTYFILNALNDEALEPLEGTPGQNVFLAEYTKSGMQKWAVTRKIDPKTKLPTNRYTIRLAGDSTKLYLAPFPAPNHTSMLDPNPSVYILQKQGDDLLIRSVDRNGDSLCCVASPPSRNEVQIQPKDETSKFQWKFIATDF